MAITKEEVRHIAGLARIELTPKEEQRFEKELSTILRFIDQLNEVNTEGIAPTTGGTFLENRMRQDAQIETVLESGAAELLAAAPQKEKEWVKVKMILE